MRVSSSRDFFTGGGKTEIFKFGAKIEGFGGDCGVFGVIVKTVGKSGECWF